MSIVTNEFCVLEAGWRGTIFGKGGLSVAVFGDHPLGDLMEKYDDRSGPYFEGWYFRCQTRDGRSLALIPAIHIGEHGRKSASLQLITQERAWWLGYPASSFAAQPEPLCIRVGGCRFSEEGLLVDVEGEGLVLRGKVRFGPFHALKSDIMGPFRWLGRMECVHSVISMRHSLQGQLELNGAVVDLDGGVGYIEGDRGRSFPTAYLWTQCMWGAHSLMLSVATIPMGKLRFTGCICAIVMDGKEYRLATYRGARIQAWSSQGVVLHQGKYVLEVRLLGQKPQPLRAPTNGEMERTVHESLCAEVRYRFWRDGTLVLDHTDAYAGFEYSGGRP